MTYKEAIAEGRRLYQEAMDKAANYVLFIVEQYGKPRATVCKEIAGDGWNALDHRARALEKTAGQTPDERRRAAQRETNERAERAAKAALKDPGMTAKVIASLPDEALYRVYHEARLTRAGEDRTPAARKAAEAQAARAVEPMKKAVARTSVALAIQALREARDDLQSAMKAGAFTKTKDIELVKELANEIANLAMEAEFAEVEA